MSMDIIGHRGAKGLAQENSVAAIEQALACGVQMIEIDVRLQDGVVVLSHDAIMVSRNYTTLSEALAAIDGTVPLNIEIKELDVLDILYEHTDRYSGSLLVSSFSFATLQRIRRERPELAIAVLEKWSSARAVRRAQHLGSRRIHMNQKWLNGRTVRSLKQRGYALHAYTVNDRHRAQKLQAWGIDGIFTDQPDLFI